MDWGQVAPPLASAVITGVAGWIARRIAQKIDSLATKADVQDMIDESVRKLNGTYVRNDENYRELVRDVAHMKGHRRSFGPT